MIKLMALEGFISPILFCDTCEERIETAAEGLILYRVRVGGLLDGEAVEKHHHVHKGECFWMMDERLGGEGERLTHWESLKNYLSIMAYRLRLDWEVFEMMDDLEEE